MYLPFLIPKRSEANAELLVLHTQYAQPSRDLKARPSYILIHCQHRAMTLSIVCVFRQTTLGWIFTESLLPPSPLPPPLVISAWKIWASRRPVGTFFSLPGPSSLRSPFHSDVGCTWCVENENLKIRGEKSWPFCVQTIFKFESWCSVQGFLDKG